MWQECERGRRFALVWKEGERETCSEVSLCLWILDLQVYVCAQQSEVEEAVCLDAVLGLGAAVLLHL